MNVSYKLLLTIIKNGKLSMEKKKIKKRIAFVLTTFVVGGVEKSFLDLLDCIDRNMYEIDVFLPDNKGEWIPLLEKKCNVRYLKIESFKKIFTSQLYKLQFFSVIRSLFFRVLARVNCKKNYRKSTEYFLRSMPRVKEKYDCAVAYQIINDDCVLGTLYRIKASKKAAWTHSYTNKREPIYGKWYGMFDKIFCVSNYSRESFINNFPELSYKTEVFYNTINQTLILKKAGEDVNFIKTSEVITLVTVARLSAIKGQIMIPHTARLLVDAGYSIKWYLVGDGESYQEIIEEIHKEKVEDIVILMGNRNNPYPYIKACDIYVQTSIIEGWGLTISEAKVLCKPIVTTDAGAINEQIQNGVNGIIVSETTPEALAKGIGQLIENSELCDSFISYLQKENANHLAEIEKLYRFMNE